MAAMLAHKPINIVPSEERAEEVRQLIRSRYPILTDGTYVNVDGRIGGDWFAKRGIVNAIRGIRTETSRKVGRTRPYAPEALRGIIERIDQTKFNGYSSTAEVMLMAVGPRRVHAYWHLPEISVQQARLTMGEASHHAALVLRFYDVTGIDFNGGNANHSFDVEVGYEEERRHVELWSPDRHYVTEVGLRAQDGWFVAIARSNAVHVPRDIPGEHNAAIINVSDNASKIIRPAVPELFRVNYDRIIVKPGDADWPMRDLYAENRIKKIYTGFLAEGPRALNTRESIRRPVKEQLLAEYNARQEALKAAPAETPAPKLRAQETAVRPDL
ncbi:MAG: DUF4912 domain-containing protein, partial [Planctomycetes bacterium]|nr:DUF4912 domain-containing protein [Planctomycetota bacterium]